MKIRLHYNRFGAPEGKPWTLHTSKGCFAASHVQFKVPVETEECPERKTNPRYFILVHGEISWKGTIATVIAKSVKTQR